MPTALEAAIRADDGTLLVGNEVMVGSAWARCDTTLTLPVDADPEAVYRFSIRTTGQAHLVLASVVLRPGDHIDGADPDVVSRLRESRLPILRWPGGSFVSGYHWRDGVGKPAGRPTRPNPAWSGLEYNLFGTDEFVAFCRAVGCEPMICVNAGNGSPEEAIAMVTIAMDDGHPRL